MKFFNLFVLCLFYLHFFSCGNQKKEAKSKGLTTTIEDTENTFEVFPIQHATMVLHWNGVVIYVDPVGGAAIFEGQKQADLILITDVSSDHFNLETLEELNTKRAKIIVPQAVANSIPKEFTPQLDVLDNGAKKERFGITVEAVPMYRIKKEALEFHPKGRGNGYVLEMKGERIYISGNTKVIPEMRDLQNIDKAFVFLTQMSVENTVDAVLQFQPDEVYPYPYKETEGLSDIQKFKALVNSGNKIIEVKLLNWWYK